MKINADLSERIVIDTDQVDWTATRLAGVISDQYGDFKTGTYVRNPIGSADKPHTVESCTILLKTGHLARLEDASQSGKSYATA